MRQIVIERFADLIDQPLDIRLPACVEEQLELVKNLPRAPFKVEMRSYGCAADEREILGSSIYQHAVREPAFEEGASVELNQLVGKLRAPGLWKIQMADSLMEVA